MWFIVSRRLCRTCVWGSSGEHVKGSGVWIHRSSSRSWSRRYEDGRCFSRNQEDQQRRNMAAIACPNMSNPMPRRRCWNCEISSDFISWTGGWCSCICKPSTGNVTGGAVFLPKYHRNMQACCGRTGALLKLYEGPRATRTAGTRMSSPWQWGVS